MFRPSRRRRDEVRLLRIRGSDAVLPVRRPTGLVRYRARTLQTVVGSLYVAAGLLCGRKPWSLRCGEKPHNYPGSRLALSHPVKAWDIGKLLPHGLRGIGNSYQFRMLSTDHLLVAAVEQQIQPKPPRRC
ncbi:hypothetical protein Hamer_G009895 [Homarus americanus]|uniref:Uncharacterized protein n=1 Tax=Homarus americanus TaxID=6706 RepID=A0A8J5N8J7_HOMAM|nr:hypothetical protein Hamer_G009895 [Homarus americanus]